MGVRPRPGVAEASSSPAVHADLLETATLRTLDLGRRTCHLPRSEVRRDSSMENGFLRFRGSSSVVRAGDS